MYGALRQTDLSNDGLPDDTNRSPPSADNSSRSSSAAAAAAASSSSWHEDQNTATSSSNELFREQQDASSSSPWWQMKLNPSSKRRQLFGVWDGVFASCIINMFGVIIFIRTGWIVGNAGIVQAVLIILLTVSVGLITALSAIGITECCHLHVSGGLYLLLSHVLGARLGAAISLIFCFGQSVACSLCVVAFGESMLDLLVVDNIWTSRAIAAGILVILVVINIAGAQWVIGLQLVFLVLLLMAVLDFFIGSFVRYNPGEGVVGYSVEVLSNNTGANYLPGETFFTVLGVFFPSASGVLAGVNMSGDLRDPTDNIALGTLAAVIATAVAELLFALVLGSTCTRTHLQSNYIIAEKLSATRILWLIGMYELSISSALGNMSGPPNILQGIANDHVIGFLTPLGKGFGENKIPVFAILVMSLISFIFIFVGPLNTLGLILTVPYMITYAAVDYAHFSLVMSVDRKSKTSTPDPAPPPADADPLSPRSCSSDEYEWEAIDGDLDLLFPAERSKTGKGYDPRVSDYGAMDECERTAAGIGSQQAPAAGNSSANGGCGNNGVIDSSSHLAPTTGQHSMTRMMSLDYSALCNRWVSLIGAVMCVVAMFCIAWSYALANLCVLFVIWYVIGQTNPLVFPGVSEFNVWRWISDGLCNRCRRQPRPEVYVSSPPPSGGRNVFDVATSQLSEDNIDFALRERYHQSQPTTDQLRLD